MHPELEDDLSARHVDQGRLKLHRTVHGLLAELADKDPQPLARAGLMAEPVLETVRLALDDSVYLKVQLLQSVGALGSLAMGFPGVGEIEVTEARSRGDRRVLAYQVGEERWASAEVAWTVRMPVTLDSGLGHGPVPAEARFFTPSTVVVKRGDDGAVVEAEVVQLGPARDIELSR